MKFHFAKMGVWPYGWNDNNCPHFTGTITQAGLEWFIQSLQGYANHKIMPVK